MAKLLLTELGANRIKNVQQDSAIRLLWIIIYGNWWQIRDGIVTSEQTWFSFKAH